jgi:fibrillarin-like pre-rRNA processing protein
MLKTRSVDVRQEPVEVLAGARAGLEEHLDVTDVRWLDPYHHDHAAIVCTLRE